MCRGVLRTGPGFPLLHGASDRVCKVASGLQKIQLKILKLLDFLVTTGAQKNSLRGKPVF